MKWPWQRDPEPEPQGGLARERAERDLAAAEKSLEATKAQWPEVLEVAASLRDLRRKNHFGAAIENLYAERGRK